MAEVEIGFGVCRLYKLDSSTRVPLYCVSVQCSVGACTKQLSKAKYGSKHVWIFSTFWRRRYIKSTSLNKPHRTLRRLFGQPEEQVVEYIECFNFEVLLQRHQTLIPCGSVAWKSFKVYKTYETKDKYWYWEYINGRHVWDTCRVTISHVLDSHSDLTCIVHFMLL